MNCAQNIYKNKNFDGFDDLECGDLENLTEEIGQNSKKLTIEDLTKEEAERLYYEEKKDFYSMSKLYNTTYFFLRKKFFKLGCKTRTRSEISKEFNKKRKINITKEALYDLYYNQKKSHCEIAAIFGCTSTIVSRRMKEFGMAVRSPKERDEISSLKRKYDIKKEDIENLIEEGLCCGEIAKRLNVSAPVVVARVTKFQINREKLDLTIRKRRGGSFDEVWTPKTPLQEAIRTSTKYIKWRQECFDKDDYTCRICKKKGGNLQVDHIKPFSFIVKKYKIDSLEKANNCLELWDINNGRTLCVDCHKKTDTFTKKALKYKEGDTFNV